LHNQKKVLFGILSTTLVLGIVIPMQTAFAYEEDIHYWLKFKLGLYCGYSVNQARLIATGDQGVDANFSTEPTKTSPFEHGGNPLSSDTYENLNIKIKWHALPQDNPVSDPGKGIPEIKQGQDALYKRAMTEKNPSIKLIKFGQYLHYIEDKWSHWGYTYGVGHGLVNVFGDSPDNPGVTSLAVKDMIYDIMTQMGGLSGKDSKCFNGDLGGDNPFMTPVNFTPDFKDIYPHGPPPASNGVSNQPMSGQRDSYLKSLDDSNPTDKITDFYNDLINTAKKATANGGSLEEVVALDIVTIQNHIAIETGTSLGIVQHDYDFITPWTMHGPFGFALWVFSSKQDQGIHWDEDGEPIETINPDPDKVFDDPKINPHPHTPSVPPTFPKTSLQPPAKDAKTSKLLVIKHVINDGGGTAKASDFTITVQPGPYLTATPSQFSGSEEGTEVTLSGNFDQMLHYTVKESSSYGDKYKVSYTDNCSTYINKGEYLGCVIYNRYVSPTGTSNETSHVGLIPKWVQNNALWWSQGQVKDKEFATAIGYLVSQKIIQLESKSTAGAVVSVSDDISIPQWIKNNANWWSKGIITDSDFVKGLQYMLDNDIITFSKHVSASSVVNQKSTLKLRIINPNTDGGLDSVVEITGNGRTIKKTTDRDGYVDVTLPDGSYTVQIDSRDFARMKVPLQVHGDTKKEITMGESDETESANSGIPGDFEVTISPNEATMEQDVGTYSDNTIEIDSTVPFPNPISVDVSVDPPGLGVEAHEDMYSTITSPGSIQKNINGKYHLGDLIYVVVDQYTPPGTYLVKVNVRTDMGSGMVSKSSTLTVHVTPPKTFSISVSPNEVTVVQGGSTSTHVTATTDTQLAGAVYLMAGNGPDIHSGLKGEFSGTSVESDPLTGRTGGAPVTPTRDFSNSRVLTISAKPNAVLGTHTMWVNGHTGIPFNDGTGIVHESNMYVPVTVHVIPATGQDASQTSSGAPKISATPTFASFVHTIGVTSCPELISQISLKSDQEGTWSAIGNPTWSTITIQNGVATINFNCNLSQYVSQTLSGDVEFMFKGAGGVNSVSVPIKGQIIKN
jgi:hypothetical protein